MKNNDKDDDDDDDDDNIGFVLSHLVRNSYV